MATFSTNEGMRLLVGFTCDCRQLVKAIETLGLLHRERSADGLNLVFNVEELPTSTAQGRTDQVCVLAFTAGATCEAGAAFEIKAQPLDKEGGPIRIGRMQLVRQVAETDGFRRFVLNVTPEGVPPGESAFRLKLRDPATRALSEADRPVRVE